MDQSRFDALSRAVARSTSRRAVLSGALGLLAAAFGTRGGGTVAACEKAGTACTAAKACCGGACCGGVCVELLTNPRHCGACGAACQDGACFQGTCIGVIGGGCDPARCGPCEVCDDAGRACVSTCDHNRCEGCDETTGTCVSICNPLFCQACHGGGVCRSVCDLSRQICVPGGGDYGQCVDLCAPWEDWDPIERVCTFVCEFPHALDPVTGACEIDCGRNRTLNDCRGDIDCCDGERCIFGDPDQPRGYCRCIPTKTAISSARSCTADEQCCDGLCFRYDGHESGLCAACMPGGATCARYPTHPCCNGPCGGDGLCP